MRRILMVGAAAVVPLVACAGEQSVDFEHDSPSTSHTEESSISTVPEVPPSPEPARTEECPYLDTEFASRANGQRIAEVKISSDEPHPTCFFYRPDGSRQLDVQVYVGESEVADALIDAAAPLDSSSPATEPVGWEGGYRSTDDGAVYAVAQDGDAVIVTTNQQQSVKARSIAEEVISKIDF